MRCNTLHVEPGYAPLSVLRKFQDMAERGRDRFTTTSTITVIDWVHSAKFGHATEVTKDQSSYNAWLAKGLTLDDASLKFVGNDTTTVKGEKRWVDEWSLTATIPSSGPDMPRTRPRKLQSFCDGIRGRILWSENTDVALDFVRSSLRRSTTTISQGLGTWKVLHVRPKG